jgi:diguanylate cyclase (GGDEF)-like protein
LDARAPGMVVEGSQARRNLSIRSEAFDQLRAQLTGSSLELFLENTRMLVVILDSQGAPLSWNPAFDILRESQPAARTLPEFVSGAARLEFVGSFRDVVGTGTPARLQLELGSPTGRSRYDCYLMPQADDGVLFIGEPVHEDADHRGDGRVNEGEVEALKAELQDARRTLDAKRQELQAVIAQADEVSHTDMLTLLPNRRAVISDLQRQVNLSERYDLPLTISMIDLDNFKEINDTFGHAAGDQVLRFVASEMRDHIRQPDEIGRYGGDEFLVILPNTAEHAAAEQASRLCQQLHGAPILVGQDVIHMSLSIGIAQYRPRIDDWRTLVERADQALYQAKHNGRGQWVVLQA